MAVAKAKSEDALTLAGAYPAAATGAAWIEKVRAEALARFQTMGAPERRDEYWKFSNPAHLTMTPAARAQVLVTGEAPVFGEFDRLRVVFVDGVFRPDLSDPLELSGIEIETLGDAAAKDIHWAGKLFGELAKA
jgi:Fe-S cluster assembly protein SufD